MIQENSILSELSQNDLQKIRDRIRGTKINVLMVGGTGVGKSSTISALFQSQGKESKATIGQGATPETMDISAHEIDNLIIWDTPGLGDSPKKDENHREKIIELLCKKDDNGQPLIDLIFIVLDAHSRDFGSAYSLIEDVIRSDRVQDVQDRILIGINQADQAMKGHYWNKEENKPESKLVERLENLVQTVKGRIKEDTGLDVDPIYYSAGCVMDGEVLSHPYNLQKLLSFILDRLPKKKRAVISQSVNENEENFRSNDDKEDYQAKVNESIFSSLMGYIKEIATDVGENLKKILTDPDNLKLATTTVISGLVAYFKKSK